MTKKELTSVYYIKKEIKMWEEQLELIESKAEGKAMQITACHSLRELEAVTRWQTWQLRL